MEWNRRAAGPSGQLRSGYRVAAKLGAWDIAPSGEWGKADPGGEWSFVAQTASGRNDHLLRGKGPFVLVLEDQFGRRLRCAVEKVFNDEKIGAHGKGAPEVISEQARGTEAANQGSAHRNRESIRPARPAIVRRDGPPPRSPGSGGGVGNDDRASGKARGVRNYFVAAASTRLFEDADSAALRFVPEPKKKGEAWIEVKTKLNYGEQLGLMSSLLGGDVPVEALDGKLDGIRVGLQSATIDMVATWLVDWSFTDEDGPVECTRSAIENLDPEIAEAVRDSISNFVAGQNSGKAQRPAVNRRGRTSG